MRQLFIKNLSVIFKTKLASKKHTHTHTHTHTCVCVCVLRMFFKACFV